MLKTGGISLSYYEKRREERMRQEISKKSGGRDLSALALEASKPRRLLNELKYLFGHKRLETITEIKEGAMRMRRRRASSLCRLQGPWVPGARILFKHNCLSISLGKSIDDLDLGMYVRTTNRPVRQVSKSHK